MYRTGLFPHTAHETDVDGRTVHYSPHTGKIHPGVRYTDQGFWDTSRTLLPLFSLIRRDLYADIVESALNDYRESGWLPKWISPGETGGMPGTLIDSVLAQAATRRLTAPDTLKEILAAMRHHADHQAPENRFGRHGVEDYLHLGYVPGDRYSESVNLTLDYAYGDYCIARVAALLKDTRTSQEYLVRSENYKSLFDSQSGFMRARTAAGEFVTPFDPCCWGRDYTEACAWQTTFQVPHDLPGLAELMGGKATLLQKLDQIFEQKPIYRVGGYGKEIHEMTEMAAADYGLCAISNQPSFLLPYLYACFGEEEKTIYWVDRICREAFHSGPDGFPGDEDNGSMAAWYLLSCIGLYPVCPADDTWIKIPARFSGTIYGESIETFKERERTYGNSDSLFQKR